jgi:hypothetical protein
MVLLLPLFYFPWLALPGEIDKAEDQRLSQPLCFESTVTLTACWLTIWRCGWSSNCRSHMALLATTACLTAAPTPAVSQAVINPHTRVDAVTVALTCSRA